MIVVNTAASAVQLSWNFKWAEWNQSDCILNFNYACLSIQQIWLKWVEWMNVRYCWSASLTAQNSLSLTQIAFSCLWLLGYLCKVWPLFSFSKFISYIIDYLDAISMHSTVKLIFGLINFCLPNLTSFCRASLKIKKMMQYLSLSKNKIKRAANNYHLSWI